MPEPALSGGHPLTPTKKFTGGALALSPQENERMKLSSYVRLLLVSAVAFLAIGCDDSSVSPTTNTRQPNTPVVAPAAVYTMTNDATQNAVREYRRDTNGALTFVADYPTGGSGSGDTLDSSSNALIFSAGTNRFYAVNAGSNSLTAMVLGTDGKLTNLSTVNSGGTRPISVAAFGDTVYVLNAGNAGNNIPANITGFQMIGSQLQPLAGSTQALSAANPNPAEIEFTPSGTVLVVTERGTNNITTFNLNTNGVAGPAQAQAANGVTPFGFDFTPGGVLVVSNATSGNAGASTASSYNVGVAGTISTISGSVANNQTGACWVEVARNAPFAYITNTGSNSVSIYNVDANGALTLVGNGNSATTGSGPVDLDISNDSTFLYVLNRNDDSISSFRINADGTLTGIGTVTGLPANSVGMIAR